MRIRKLELSGFKSFVDPTVLELSSGISAIVGPNGCGKSNLVDALRWVLGEQSPSRLRGGAMEDVLFNGSAHRGPVGMAEVSLLLENEGGPGAEELPETLRDVAEILVTRRYFRSGESEYLINRRPCRLKDITELFLGTGAGTRAYSMIEQGKVDQLVNAKPEEIRLFIEEAAGTTRYRSRRIAAERKLERTRDNLSRVNDMLREIDRSISIFRRMAKRAEQYRQLQEELRHVELQLGRRRRDRLSSEIDEADRRCHDLRTRERDLASTIEAFEAERTRARRELGAVEEELRGQQETLFDLRTRRERSEARLEMLERDVAAAEERLDRLGREQVQLTGRIATTAEEAEAREADLSILVEQRRRRGEDLETSLDSLGAEEAALSRLVDSLEGAKNEIVDLLSRESEVRNRIASLEQRLEERRAGGDRLSGELHALEEDASRRAAELDRIAGRRREIEARFEEVERQLEDARTRVDATRRDREELEQAGAALARSVVETESRLESAEEVERGFTRYQQGVRTIMQRHQERANGILNLVARVLETPPDVERAVAAVLGDRLQHVIVRRPEDACEAIGELQVLGAGRGSFVPVEPAGGTPQTSRIVPRPLAGGQRLIDLVRVEEGYANLAENLLGDAVLVEDLDQALELYRRNGVVRTVVTRDGSVFRPDGVISGGSEAPYEEQLLAHRREIRRLREELARLREELEAVEVRRDQASREAAAAAARLEELEGERREVAPARVGIQKDEERASDGLARARSQLARSEEERKRLEAERGALEKSLEESASELEEIVGAREALQGDRQRIERELGDRRESLDARNQAATDLKVELAQLAEKERRLRETLERLHALRAELEERSSAIGAEIDDLRGRATGARDEAETLRSTLEDGRRREAQHGTTVEGARAGAAALRERIEETERRLESSRSELDTIRSERSGADLQRAEKAMHREALEAEIRDRYQLELTAVDVEPADEETLSRRFDELRGRVERLGASKMGMEAVGELEEEEKRREFLLGQKNDLEASVADLQKTIASLNRASRDRFAETFDAVNAKFQETFPKLFRGGRARLQFTDESNLLETGVDIQVQPPGMNLRALSLLSGGQKALTAVSLIFSLFLCRPSPFCVLDEVDAPLDDANIDRFNGIVSEMGETSQFLLITHNKRTMEVAETLYGVTMEEPGVSKIVSVRFQRAA